LTEADVFDELAPGYIFLHKKNWNAGFKKQLAHNTNIINENI
jgi:hypothetical protein